MFDAKLMRNRPDEVREMLRNRGADASPVDRFLELDTKRRDLIQKGDQLKNLLNTTSRQIGIIKKQGGDIAAEQARMREVGDQIKAIDIELGELEQQTVAILERLPNMPHESVPPGKDAAENVQVRSWGEPKQYSFTPRAHWDVAESLGIIDFERAAKLSGSRFVLLRGQGALLERALITFMLDLHTTQHGYEEIAAPYLVTRETIYGTGQVPKFEEDLFKTQQPELFLIPTAEVPITNLHRGEILDGAELPKYYTGYTACFRAEAGAAGRDTRGLIRVHQFDKVELVKFARPEESYDELEKMTRDAEKVLQLLGIPHRTMLLCRGDMGFAAAKTYDIEFWSPGQHKWIEISSCSNCGDFQARRAEIRYRREPKAKAELLHTLNGSGIAVGRTVAALLETYQEEDGSVRIPDVLRPYMRGAERITRATPVTVG
ncbi:MAG: serine--tRNA ligase [Candidatus Xenobia bacterium]